MPVTSKLQQNIPSGWSPIKVGDIGSTYSGLRSKSKSDFGYGSPFITYMNIFSNSKIDKNRFDLVNVSVGENQSKVKYGDVFFTVSSETPEEVGMSSVLLDEVDNYYLNSFCFGFRLNDFDTLLPQYAQFLFRGQDFRSKIIKMSQGSTRFNLSKERVLSLDIILPPIKEQQKIAEILEMVDEDIAKTQEVIKTTEKLKRGLMQQLFTRGVGHTKFKETEIGEIPKEWEVVKLSEIAKVERGKFSHRPRNAPEFYGGVIPFIQTGDVVNSNGKIISYTQTLNKKGLSVSKLFKKGTIVITIAANIGDTGILQFDSCFPDSLIGITPLERVDATFLEYYLRTQKKYLNSISTQSAQKNINLEKLNPLLVVLPTNSEQQKIVNILSNIDEKILVNKKLKAKLTLLKKGLMQDLLSGTVRVNNL